MEKNYEKDNPRNFKNENQPSQPLEGNNEKEKVFHVKRYVRIYS